MFSPIETSECMKCGFEVSLLVSLVLLCFIPRLHYPRHYLAGLNIFIIAKCCNEIEKKDSQKKFKDKQLCYKSCMENVDIHTIDVGYINDFLEDWTKAILDSLFKNVTNSTLSIN